MGCNTSNNKIEPFNNVVIDTNQNNYKKKSVLTFLLNRKFNKIWNQSTNNQIEDKSTTSHLTPEFLQIESFLSEAMNQCCKVSTLKNMLEDPNAVEAFTKFLRTEFAEENLHFVAEVEKIMRGDPNELIGRIQDLTNSFLKPGSSNEININRKMKLDILMNANSTKNDELLKSLSNAQNEIISIMALGAFPRFLRSNEYKEWRNQVYSSEGTVHEIANHDLEAKQIVESNNWINVLFRSAEVLPICVSVATANINRPGFPLIYVNKCFEITTGYNRSDIIGKNCSFLQSTDTEKESIEKLSTSLKNAQPVKVFITNYKKDGTKFENLLAMKPIFDNKGVYKFVVGVQFSTESGTSNSTNSSNLMISDALLNLIPDVIYASDIKDEEFFNN